MSKLNPAIAACAVVVMSMAAAGCSRLSARTVPIPPPPLDVPAPPPRVVETADVEPPPPGTLVDAPTGGAPSTRQPVPRVAAPKPEQPKPEPSHPVTEQPQPVEAAKPATTLQTTPPDREPVLEQEIRTRLDRANRDLNRVDYQKLGNDARSQYDQAKRFATQAEEAIKQKNFVFARTLAENAANIAAQLAGR